MSADAWVNCAHCGHTVAELNVTYNLSPMLAEAGFGRWRDWEGRDARDFIAAVIAVKDVLLADPERFKALNPPNGWGSYDELVDSLRSFLAAIGKNPDLTLEIWS